ncbi:MAG: NUDIX hydrolase [Proteobacteria bacterium]|nr:NUDIX hydrolase [Pseudomonadota bacterium]
MNMKTNDKTALQKYPYPLPVVRMIIEDEKGRVLILQRPEGDEHGPNAWSLPGGKIDYGDTIEQACERELFEETQLTCTTCDFLFYQDSLPIKSGGIHCINFYLKCVVKGEVNINAESRHYAWISADNLSHYEIAFRNDEALVKYWKGKYS